MPSCTGAVGRPPAPDLVPGRVRACGGSHSTWMAFVEGGALDGERPPPEEGAVGGAEGDAPELDELGARGEEDAAHEEGPGLADGGGGGGGGPEAGGGIGGPVEIEFQTG